MLDSEQERLMVSRRRFTANNSKQLLGEPDSEQEMLESEK
jgi:hypothetical protein